MLKTALAGLQSSDHHTLNRRTSAAVKLGRRKRIEISANDSTERNGVSRELSPVTTKYSLKDSSRIAIDKE
jgi:hypothetical protein